MSAKYPKSISKGFIIILIVMLALAAMPVAPTHAAGTDYSQPTSYINGGGTSGWTNPVNAFASDDAYATAEKNGRTATYYGFSFAALPAGSVINGIEVAVEGNTTGRQVNVDLSWDSGVTFTTGAGLKTTTLTAADTVVLLGGASDLWGTAHAWTASDFSDTSSFRVRLTSAVGTNVVSVDQLRVKVYYAQPGTTTAVDCGAGTPSVTYGSSITCTATVTHIAGTITPTGTVDWTGSEGTFTPAACTLAPVSTAAASCSVSYQPDAVASGSHLITAAYPGDAFLTSSSGDQTLTVTPLTINVTADAKTRIYGDADPALTHTYDPPLVGEDSFSGALSRDAGDHVGEYSITQGTLALSTDYTLLYTGAKLTVTPLTINVTADAKTRIYGNADPVLTYTYDPPLVGEDSFSGALSRDAGDHVGEYSITQGILALSADYTLLYTGAKLTVTPLSIIVTADPKSKAVGTADPALTYTVNPALLNGDEFTGALVRTPGEDAGTYPILIGTLSAGADYDLTFVGADFIIAVPPVVTLHPASVTIIRGGTATFTADASGDPVPTVIWQISTDGGQHFTDLSGETSRTLTITAPPLGSNGNRYRAVFTNGGGSVTTDPATLTFLYYILSIPLVLR